MKKTNLKQIILAAGCFWGVEHFFSLQKGIIDVESVYVNGKLPNPSYEYVCSQKDTFVEGVKIIYDKSIISLAKLLKIFLNIIDPVNDLQSNDRGIQYVQGIYWSNKDDLVVINDFINSLKKEHSNNDIKINVEKLHNYYLAEDYHQKYLIKNPNGYCHINKMLFKNFNNN